MTNDKLLAAMCELGDKVERLERGLEGLFAALPALVELAQETLDRRARAAESGRAGGQKSGETRRAKGASIGDAKGASRKTARNTRRVLRSTGDDSEIKSKHPSPADYSPPLSKKRSGSVNQKDSEESIEDDSPGGSDAEIEAPFDLSIPEPSGKRGRGRPKKPPIPGLARCRELHEGFYERDYGCKPTRSGKTAGQLARLVSQHGETEVARRIELAFTSPPSWPPPPYDLGVLAQHFDKFVGAQSSRALVSANGLAYGRFEPSDSTDYRSPWDIKADRDAGKAKHETVADRPPWETT